VDSAPELEEFTRAFFDFFARRDAESMVDAISKDPGTTAIGTAEEEWWIGPDILKTALSIQAGEMPDFVISVDQVVGHKEGSIGWVSMNGSIDMTDGTSSRVRSSLVLRREGAYWRIVHIHMSGTTSNEDLLGRTLTTAFDELIDLVRDEPPPMTAAAADGSVTIVFTDIEGSTALMESLGEESWTAMLAWHDAVVVQQTRTFGGTVVKGQGDGFMLAFPSSGAATACALSIQHSLSAGWSGVPVSVRIGIHCGNARESAGDFFGRTVIIAARVASAANGGEILVSHDVQASLAGAFALGEPETLNLKGLSGAHTLFPVIVT